MVQLTNVAWLFATAALLPFTLAVRGEVKVSLPGDTCYTTVSKHACDPGKAVVLPFDKAETQTFAWHGPMEHPDDPTHTERAWTQTCSVTVQDSFNENIEFTLRTEKAGFAGAKDKPASIKCGEDSCLIGTCDGDFVIPFVDSTV